MRDSIKKRKSRTPRAADNVHRLDAKVFSKGFDVRDEVRTRVLVRVGEWRALTATALVVKDDAVLRGVKDCLEGAFDRASRPAMKRHDRHTVRIAPVFPIDPVIPAIEVTTLFDVMITTHAVSPEQNPNFFPTKSRYGMNRLATASLHSATPKKNVPCFLDLAGVKFLLKVERTFFFGVLPSRSRAGGGTMRTKFCKNYFLGKGFCKTSAHLFSNSDVANGKGGVWGGIFHLLLFLFWGNSGRTKNRKIKFNIVPLTFYYFSSLI